MRTYIVAYISTAVVFFALDFFWLGYVARDFYRSQLGALMREPPLLSVAAAFYAVYVVGVVVFAVVPALSGGSWRTALLLGALLGFCAYATYDLTNVATVKDWPVALAVADLSWGTVLTAVAAVAGYLITGLVARPAGAG